MPTKREVMRKLALSLVGDGYVYGATGWICTRARLDQQAKQYPQYADLIYRYGPKWIGKPCYDCAQLTRVVAKAVGVSLPSGSNSQWNAGVWKEKGAIADMPDEAGLFLFTVKNGSASHTGVSIGGGEDVDARGHAYGVVRRRIADTSYTHYARLAIHYDAPADAPVITRRTLRSGMQGDDVRMLQTRLIDLGYALLPHGADGQFGAVTRAMVRAFQSDRGLTADGIVGARTWAALDGAAVRASVPAASGRYLPGETVGALIAALGGAQEEGEAMSLLLAREDYLRLLGGVNTVRV